MTELKFFTPDEPRPQGSKRYANPTEQPGLHLTIKENQ